MWPALAAVSVPQRDGEHQASGRSARTARQHPLIHGGEDLAGVLRVVREGAHCADTQKGNCHGSRHALPTDVANHRKHATVACCQDLKKNATDLTGRLVEAVNGKSRHPGDISN